MQTVYRAGALNTFLPPRDMIAGDFLMRQVHQLAQVLARALALRQTEDVQGVLDELRAAWRQDPALGGGRPAEPSRDALLETCSVNGRFFSEKALMLADLLELEGDALEEVGNPPDAATARLRARWLYEAASRDPNAAVPWNILETIERLRARSGQP